MGSALVIMNQRSKRESGAPACLVTLLVLMMMMSLSWACLGKKSHAIYLFSTVSFTEKSGELGGFDSARISPTPALPLLPPSLPVSLSLSPSSSACLSHFDSSLGSASARSPFPLPPTVVSSSISILSQCHFILPLVHSVCAPVSPSLLSVSPPLSPDAIFWTHRNQGQERNASVWASSSLHVAWGFSHVCAKEDQKDQLRSAAAASEKSISIWPC